MLKWQITFPLWTSTNSHVLFIIHCHLFSETGNQESKSFLSEEDLISFRPYYMVTSPPVLWCPGYQCTQLPGSCMVQKAVQCAEGKWKWCSLGRRTVPFPFQVFLLCSLLLLAGVQSGSASMPALHTSVGFVVHLKCNEIHSVSKQYISPPMAVFERNCAWQRASHCSSVSRHHIAVDFWSFSHLLCFSFLR